MSAKILVWILALSWSLSAGASNGWFLCIGVSDVNDSSYAGLNLPNLKVCEQDARAMAAFARAQGLTNIRKTIAGDDTPLTGSKAKKKAVVSALLALSQQASEGDLVFISYSGHGSQVHNTNNDERTDETWCLYDGPLIDDELALYWVQFKKDVRIILVSDSCYGGGANKAVLAQEHPGVMSKALDTEAQTRLDQTYADEWNTLPGGTTTMRSFRGSMLLMAACSENEESYVINGDSHSLFTKHFLAVVREGGHEDNYNAFMNNIIPRVTAGAGRLYQTPELNKEGRGARKLAKEKVCTP